MCVAALEGMLIAASNNSHFYAPLPPTTGLPRWPTFPDGEAERLRRLDVEDQLDSCSLLDRQIGWFLVFENAPGIDTSNIKIADAAAIAVICFTRDVKTPKIRSFESHLTAKKMEEDVHAHHGTCTRERTGSVLHGSGFSRNEAFG
jgi:hypothetical protein